MILMRKRYHVAEGAVAAVRHPKDAPDGKKAVVWVVALLILLAIVKVINHQGAENREEPAATNCDG